MKKLLVLIALSGAATLAMAQPASRATPATPATPAQPGTADVRATPAIAATPASPAEREAGKKGPKAQKNKTKTCNQEARTRALKGEERKQFVSECIAG